MEDPASGTIRHSIARLLHIYIDKNVTKLDSNEYVVHAGSRKEKLDVCQRITLRNPLPGGA